MIPKGTTRRQKVICAHFNKAKKQFEGDTLKFAMKEDDIETWYALIKNISGVNDEFVGGEYLVRITFPEKYPGEPIDFKFMTPNGVFQPEQNVCVHIGKFHKENQKAAITAGSFVMQVISGFICHEGLSGIGIEIKSHDTKVQLAKNSKKYNKNTYPTIMKLFEDDAA